MYMYMYMGIDRINGMYMHAYTTGGKFKRWTDPSRTNSMSLLQLGSVLFGCVDAYLWANGLLSHSGLWKVIHCMETYYAQIPASCMLAWPKFLWYWLVKQLNRCSVAMQEWPRPDISDSKSWWCPQCKGRKSIRTGSFFAKSRLSLQKLILLYLWVQQYPLTDAMEEAEGQQLSGLGKFDPQPFWHTNIVLGGPGKIVLHHKPN